MDCRTSDQNVFDFSQQDDSPCLKVYFKRKKFVLEPVQDEESVLSSQLQELKNDVLNRLIVCCHLLESPIGGGGLCLLISFPGVAGEWPSFLQSWVLVLLPRSVDNWVFVMKWRTSLLRMPTVMQGYSKMGSLVAILLQLLRFLDGRCLLWGNVRTFCWLVSSDGFTICQC